LVVKNLPEGMGIISGYGGTPFTIYEGVTFMMGAVPFFIALHTDPSLIKDIFSKIGSYSVAYFSMTAEHKHVGACSMADDMGYRVGPMMAPKYYREYVFPWMKRCAEVSHKHGKHFILHSCDNLEVLMDDLINYVGINAKHSFEDTTYPVTRYKKMFRNSIALLGGVPIEKFCQMPIDDLRRYVRNIIRECAPGGGYALGSGNSVTNCMKLENYLAMLEVGRRYGKYLIK
jgi:uroporphyrinogen decarboxylase